MTPELQKAYLEDKAVRIKHDLEFETVRKKFLGIKLVIEDRDLWLRDDRLPTPTYVKPKKKFINPFKYVIP